MNAALNISEQKEVEMGLHFYARVTNVIFYYFICCMEKWRFVDYLFMSIQINFPSRFEKFSFSALCTSFRVIFFDSYPVVMGPQTVLLFVGTPESMSLCWPMFLILNVISALEGTLLDLFFLIHVFDRLLA